MKAYSVVASRYAEALYGLAGEMQQKSAVYDAMQQLAAFFAESDEFRAFLRNPVLHVGKKREIIHNTLHAYLPELVMGFVDKLVAARREALLGEIAAAYQELYLRGEGVLTASVKSARPLYPDIREKLIGIVKSASVATGTKEIRLEESVDESLIGGLVLRVGDLQVDASVSRRLDDLRQVFSSNPYTPKI